MKERTALSLSERNGLMKNLTMEGHSTDVLDLVRSDLEFGLSKNEIERYLDKKWNLQQKRIFSKCLRADYGEEVLAVIMREGSDGHQMQVALEFYEKGIPLKTIEEVLLKNDTPRNMSICYQAVLAKMQEVREASAIAPEYMKELVAKMENAVSSIRYQEERYDELNRKISEMESGKQEDEIRDQFAKKLDETEKMLSDSQNQVNQAKSTIARLRNQMDEKDREIAKMQSKIDSLEGKLHEKPTENHQAGVSTYAADNGYVPNGVPKPEAVQQKEVFVSYSLPVNEAGKTIMTVPVERSARRGAASHPSAGFFAKLCFKKKSRQDIVKLVVGGDLSPAQLIQIRNAMMQGLTEGQLTELINNNVSADKMKEIIEIAVLENSMAE